MVPGEQGTGIQARGPAEAAGHEGISESSLRVNEMALGDWVGQEAGHGQREAQRTIYR